ncbi:transposase [soil metagenome]
MSTKYKATEPEGVYFATITVVGWIDVFTRESQKNMLIESLQYCQKEKGLEVYAYCIMTNHLHMICKAIGRNELPSIIRDFKKFTSKNIIRLIQEEPESRKEWMLNYFEKACIHLTRDQKYKVWKDGYHGELLYSNKFLLQKLHYIHQNPVKAGIVDKPGHYTYSSAQNYEGLEGKLDVVLLTWP